MTLLCPHRRFRGRKLLFNPLRLHLRPHHAVPVDLAVLQLGSASTEPKATATALSSPTTSTPLVHPTPASVTRLVLSRTLTHSPTKKQCGRMTVPSGLNRHRLRSVPWSSKEPGSKSPKARRKPRSSLAHGRSVARELQMVRSRSTKADTACEVTSKKKNKARTPRSSLGQQFVSFLPCH